MAAKRKPGKTRKHPGKTEGKLSPTKRRAARAIAEGATCAEAAEIAGLSSKRARARVTVAEWKNNDPLFQKEVEDWTKKQMDAMEVNGRLAAMARGELPAKDTEKFGEERHQLKALETLGHHMGLRKSSLKLEGEDRPDLSNLTEEELETLLRLTEKARGNAGDGGERKAEA